MGKKKVAQQTKEEVLQESARVEDTLAKKSAQGVRQVCPLDTLASAPGGSDSKRTESMIGAGFNPSRFIQSGVDEHAASASAPTTMPTMRRPRGSALCAGARPAPPRWSLRSYGDHGTWL